MCGIIGYIGNQAAPDILLSGLRRMEYRGYDSAGIATIEENELQIHKKAGKLDNLLGHLDGNKLTSTVGIGHTRWATHGGPTDDNAHPHQAGKVAIVHNGIVENYQELKVELEKRGATFRSQTDTEVLAWLIEKEFESTKNLTEAVCAALHQVRGAFGLVVMSSDEPETLVAARRGSPIVVGIAKDETFIASDTSALAGRATEFLYLQDDEMAVCKPGHVQILDFDQNEQARDPIQLDIKPEQAQKQGYPHFLIKEINEQPETVRAVLRGRLDMDAGTAHLGGLNLSEEQIKQMKHIIITGCGTAYYAGLFAKYMLEKIVGVPVSVEMASELRYRDAAIPVDSLGVIISQSGETADTRAALLELKRRDIHSLGVVNVVGSTIAREVDGGIYLHAGPEISVASTKAFTSQVLAQLLLGVQLARHRGMGAQEGKEIISALERLPEEIESILKLSDQVKNRADELAKFEDALYLGRDTLFPIALEGSHKLKEISYVHAEAYPSGEMKHGANALIDENMLIVYLLGKGALYEKSLSNLQEASARNGKIVVLTDSQEYADQHKDALFVETGSPWTAPLVMNVVLQLLAYHIAAARGCEIDQPRNLAKSVTVE